MTVCLCCCTVAEWTWKWLIWKFLTFRDNCWWNKIKKSPILLGWLLIKHKIKKASNTLEWLLIKCRIKKIVTARDDYGFSLPSELSKIKRDMKKFTLIFTKKKKNSYNCPCISPTISHKNSETGTRYLLIQCWL